MRYGLRRIVNFLSAASSSDCYSVKTLIRGSPTTSCVYGRLFQNEPNQIRTDQRRLTTSASNHFPVLLPPSFSLYQHRQQNREHLPQHGKYPTSSSSSSSFSSLLFNHRISSSTSHSPLLLLLHGQVRSFSSSPHYFAAKIPSEDESKSDDEKLENSSSSSSSPSSDPPPAPPPTLYQRFHKAYKNYGKVLIAFHCVSYCFWFSSFVGISYAGLDVVSFLSFLRDHLHFPQSVIDAITQSGAGHLAVAFILCKVISPIRYVTTIVGTKYTADYLKRRGYIAPIPEGDRIQELAQESRRNIARHTSDLKSRMERSGRRLRKVNDLRMKKTGKAVKDWRTNLKSKSWKPRSKR